MNNFSLIKFINKRDVRLILRRLNDYKISSIYMHNNQTYILINSNSTLHNIGLKNLLAEEQIIYKWAQSEIANTIEFINYETNTKAISGGLQLNNTYESPIVRTFNRLFDIMGILNYTTDSFSDGGKYNTHEHAISRIITLIEQGADIIDIGVESTRSNAITLSYANEIQILKPLLQEVYRLKSQYKFAISIDTYHSETIQWLTTQNIDFINDVSGALTVDVLAELINSDKQYIAMHSLTVPANPKVIIDLQQNPIVYLTQWINNKLHIFNQHNIDTSRIIFDPGIGFGKNTAQCWYIIKNIEQLSNLGCEILLGHSRKSYMYNFVTPDMKHNDLVSNMLSGLLHSKVDYFRLHDLQYLNVLYPALLQVID